MRVGVHGRSGGDGALVRHQNGRRVLRRPATAPRCGQVMGAYGADALLAEAKARGKGLAGRLRVLTHCNTGSLATAGYGTALGVIRTLHARGQLEHAFCTETRPYNQGARPTCVCVCVCVWVCVGVCGGGGWPGDPGDPRRPACRGCSCSAVRTHGMAPCT